MLALVHTIQAASHLIFLRPNSCHPYPHAHILSLQQDIQDGLLTL